MYNNDQIRDFIGATGIGQNPFGMAAAQQQYGVSNTQLDSAMGWAPNTAQGWWDQQNEQMRQTQNNAATMQGNGQQGYGVGTMTTQEQNLQSQSQNANTNAPVQNPYMAQQPNVYQGQGGPFYGAGQGQMGPAGGSQQQVPALGAPNMQMPSAGFLTGGNPTLNAGGTNAYAPQAPQQAPQQTTQPQVGQQQAGINPYLGTMANSIAAQGADNLQRNIMPAIRGGAIANGGLGGSRQGVVEANALNDYTRNLTSSLSSLYGGAFESQQGRDLQRYGMDQNAGLTTRGQDLQRYGMDQNAYLTGRGQDQNFYTAQRGQDFQGQQLGANLFQQGMQGLAQQGQGLTNVGNQQQQMGWQQLQQFANLLGPFTGLNQTQTNSTDTSGNVVGGALAGGLTLAQLYKLFSGG